MSSLKFGLQVELEDGLTFTVTADQRDVAKWELQPFGWPMQEMESRPMMTFFRFLAHSAAVRCKLTDLFKWDDFDAKCLEVMPIDEDDEEADPLAPGQSAPSATPTSRSRKPRAKA